MQHIVKLLSEGDPASLKKVIVAAQRDPALFATVISAISSDNPLVRRRAAETVEKISQKRPAYLHPYKELLIQGVTSGCEQALRQSFILMLPRLPLDEQERSALFEILRTTLLDTSDLLKVASLQTLVALAENDSALRPQAIALLQEQSTSGIPANQRLARSKLSSFTTPAAAGDSPHQRSSLRTKMQRALPEWISNQ
jgi:hypothetical protein